MISDQIANILRTAKTCAVVGLSDKADRSSYGVAEYLSKYFEIVGVNPKLSEWHGFPCYGSLSEIPSDKSIDIVDVFRRSEFVPEIVEQAIPLSPKLIWLQQGVISDTAAKLAEQAGIPIVMDACLAVVHSQLRK